MPIQVLPPQVAAKIAAGEVVERPASVVKESIENAVDAGARSIRIEVRDGGRRLMRISDDGCGIPAAEVPLAFARHATSKLTRMEDLEHLTTLGFRGEALASIAAVSRVTLVSRVCEPSPAHASIVERPSSSAAPVTPGTQIQLEGGQQLWLGAQGAPPGTTVTIENLFYNVPARLKFLKAPATEAGYIHRVVAAYAMAYPEIRFSLTLDQRVALQTSGNGNLYDVLIEVMGLDAAQQMVVLSEACAAPEPAPLAIKVTGYAGLPSLHRAQRDQLVFFVNRRWVQERSLATAVAQAYQTLLPIGRHPVAVIDLSLDPAEVDVNVHPTKSEVKFRNQPAVFATVQKAVRRCVVSAAQPPQVAIGFRPGASQPAGGAGGAGHFSGHAEEWRRLSQLGLEAQRTLPGEPGAAGAIPPLRVVGQLAQTYIIAEGPDGLYLVDQHAAHERILYEQLQAGAAAQMAAQHLLNPATLELSPAQAAVLEAEAKALARIGFDIESFGGFTYRLRSIPEILQDSDPAAALSDILADLADQAVPLARRSDERLMATVCKRAAVKAGRTLAVPEMQALIHRLEQCSAPRTCPHGRPTMIQLSTAQLAREFGRM
jgi:DNA mismatch repair protein MutL